MVRAMMKVGKLWGIGCLDGIWHLVADAPAQLFHSQ